MSLTTSIGQAQALSGRDRSAARQYRDKLTTLYGKDAAAKMAILARLAFSTPVHLDQVVYEGIEHITADDLEYARDLGLGLKLIGTAERVDGGYKFYGHKQFGSLTPVWTRLGIHAMDTSDPNALTTGIGDREEVERAFRRLNADQRAVIVLQYYRDLTLTDIAVVLQVPVGTVRSRLHYAKRALRSAIEADARPPIQKGRMA